MMKEQINETAYLTPGAYRTMPHKQKTGGVNLKSIRRFKNKINDKRYFTKGYNHTYFAKNIAGFVEYTTFMLFKYFSKEWKYIKVPRTILLSFEEDSYQFKVTTSSFTNSQEFKPDSFDKPLFKSIKFKTMLFYDLISTKDFHRKNIIRNTNSLKYYMIDFERAFVGYWGVTSANLYKKTKKTKIKLDIERQFESFKDIADIGKMNSIIDSCHRRALLLLERSKEQGYFDNRRGYKGTQTNYDDLVKLVNKFAKRIKSNLINQKRRIIKRMNDAIREFNEEDKFIYEWNVMPEIKDMDNYLDKLNNLNRLRI